MATEKKWLHVFLNILYCFIKVDLVVGINKKKEGRKGWYPAYNYN